MFHLQEGFDDVHSFLFSQKTTHKNEKMKERKKQSKMNSHNKNQINFDSLSLYIQHERKETVF